MCSYKNLQSNLDYYLIFQILNINSVLYHVHRVQVVSMLVSK